MREAVAATGLASRLGKPDSPLPAGPDTHRSVLVLPFDNLTKTIGPAGRGPFRIRVLPDCFAHLNVLYVTLPNKSTAPLDSSTVSLPMLRSFKAVDIDEGRGEFFGLFCHCFFQQLR